MKLSWLDLNGKDGRESGNRPDRSAFEVREAIKGAGKGQNLPSTGGSYIENRPIEPGGGVSSRVSFLKWLLLVFALIYIGLAYYHGPLLEQAGKYLVIRHPLKKADLIVCLMGRPVERGLAAVDLFERNLAPFIFVGREKRHDGWPILEQRGFTFPERRDLLIDLFKQMGVPASSCLTNQIEVQSTLEEALSVRSLVKDRGLKSLIVVTSPTHTRRAYLTFKKVMEGERVEIMMCPSEYSGFDPGKWWKSRCYAKEVFLEYQKMLYYYLAYFL